MSQRQPQFQAESQFGQQRYDQQQTGGQQMGGQTPGGQSMTGQQMGMGSQGTGAQLAGRLSSKQRNALTDVAQAIEVCEWCADQCIREADPNMIECIRLCEDVAELGETVLALAPRNSRFTQSVVQSFQQAVQACAQECGRHQQTHCQECAQVLSQVANSVPRLLQSPARQGMQ